MSIIDTTKYLDAIKGRSPAQRGMSVMAKGMVQSEILSIAQQIRDIVRDGTPVLNLTVGDFSSAEFPIPVSLREDIKTALDDGHSNYPPARGVLETREAVQTLFRDHLHLDYPIDSIQITSGARPAIGGTYLAVVNPGDAVLYSLPSWNNNHYCTMIGAERIEVPTRVEDGFFPKVEDFAPHLPKARLVCINSPQNPTGTAIDPAELAKLCLAIVAENRTREAAGRPPLYMMYDQVYWMLTFGGTKHVTPVGLVPEMAPYTIFVDGISKGFAATGLRVGWAVGPQDVIGKMSAILTHLGAWAPRPEQVATAKLLTNKAAIEEFRAKMAEEVMGRLGRLKKGIDELMAEGHDVDAVAPQGAIYLSLKLGIAGKKTPEGQVLDSDEAIRSYLLHDAKIGLVPFGAFGLAEGTGWFRVSVGAVSKQDCEVVIERLRASLKKLS